jgi:hypothetical protein
LSQDKYSVKWPKSRKDRYNWKIWGGRNLSAKKWKFQLKKIHHSWENPLSDW